MNNMDVKQTAPKTVQAMVHAALVSEDSQSMRSSLSEAAATNVEVKPQGITVDAALAKRAMNQSIKWVQTRYQFGRPDQTRLDMGI